MYTYNYVHKLMTTSTRHWPFQHAVYTCVLYNGYLYILVIGEQTAVLNTEGRVYVNVTLHAVLVSLPTPSHALAHGSHLYIFAACIHALLYLTGN